MLMHVHETKHFCATVAAPEGLFWACFFNSSVKTGNFTDETVIFTTSSVKPRDFTDGHALRWTIKCILTGKLLSVPSFLGYQEQFRYVFALGQLQG